MVLKPSLIDRVNIEDEVVGRLDILHLKNPTNEEGRQMVSFLFGMYLLYFTKEQRSHCASSINIWKRQ